MKIAIVQPTLEYGGAEKVILRIAERFNADIYLAGYDPKKTYSEFSDFEIRVLKGGLPGAAAGAFAHLDSDSRLSMLASAGFAFLNARMKGDYDVINAHLMPSEWIANRNERVLWYCHCPCRPAYGWRDYFMAERGAAGKAAMWAATGAYRRIESSIVPKIAKVCANSRFTKENIAAYLGRTGADVIYPGVEPRDFKCGAYEKYFLYPSRFVPEKRMEIAIDAFRKFGKKSWKLVLAGHYVDSTRNSKYLEMLKERARGLEVEFAFNLDSARLAELYSDCYAALFCGMKEDWGIVPLECMASSKPCVAFNEGGPAESIVDGKTGFLVSNATQMAEKMEYLAEHRSECEKMGKAGRKRVEQNYTWKIFLDKMEKAFKETSRL